MTLGLLPMRFVYQLADFRSVRPFSRAVSMINRSNLSGQMAPNGMNGTNVRGVDGGDGARSAWAGDGADVRQTVIVEHRSDALCELGFTDDADGHATAFRFTVSMMQSCSMGL